MVYISLANAPMKAPVEERAYHSGQVAFKKGRGREIDNPFHCATSAQAAKYWAWFEGYDDAAKAAGTNTENMQTTK